jgi:phosphosulfolactate phosphohydrolase-like enzyme
MLVARGRGADLPLCAALDAFDMVPVVRDGVLVGERIH